MGVIFKMGGILFWLRGSLRDRPGISPEITLVKTRIMTENVYQVYIFSNLQEIILMNKKLFLLTGKSDNNST
jgi:hypothetical protein